VTIRIVKKFGLLLALVSFAAQIISASNVHQIGSDLIRQAEEKADIFELPSLDG
jgi:hypothetical protein